MMGNAMGFRAVVDGPACWVRGRGSRLCWWWRGRVFSLVYLSATSLTSGSSLGLRSRAYVVFRAFE